MSDPKKPLLKVLVAGKVEEVSPLDAYHRVNSNEARPHNWGTADFDLAMEAGRKALARQMAELRATGELIDALTPRPATPMTTLDLSGGRSIADALVEAREELANQRRNNQGGR